MTLRLPSLLAVTVATALVLTPTEAQTQVRDTVMTEDLLREARYEQIGEFYYREWIDPVFLAPYNVAYSFPESARELGLPAEALASGGHLQIQCHAEGYFEQDPFNIAVRTHRVLRGDVRGTARVGAERMGPSEEWRETADQTGAVAPEKQKHELWEEMLAGDTLSVKINSRTQDLTYVFHLAGLDSLATRLEDCIRYLEE